MIYVQVAINLPVKNLFRQFMYRVPEEMGTPGAGWRVVVPFGRQETEGFIVESFSPEEAAEHFDLDKVKPITAVLGTRPWFDGEMLETARWLSSYYLCSLAEAMRLFIPGKSSIRRSAIYNEAGKLVAYEFEEKIKPRTFLAYRITAEGRAALAEGDKSVPAQMKALAVLQEQAETIAALPEKERPDGEERELAECLTVKEAGEHGVSGGILRTIAEKGWAERREKRVLRNSYDELPERLETLQLTEEQKAAVDSLKKALDLRREEPGEVGALDRFREAASTEKEFLLQGITGSGKTEVYLRAAEYALRQGKQVLVLVPEIALTAQIVRRFQAWFGDTVAVAHSKLSQNERADVWYRTRRGDAGVLIGVRSAVFAPFRNLGLVIIDEEQEGSYKQEERPSYHARDVAEKRCGNCGAVLLLGSATPSLESYHGAISGAMTHLRLTMRPTGAVLPEVTVVDMRRELAEKNFSVISRKLRRELISTVGQGEQAIVLLNRRGFSTFVMCRDCGETLMCPHCEVSLVYHADENLMRCHYCGNVAPIPTVCPECGSKRIKFFGTGTQKAEAEIANMPGVRVLRMDQDSTVAKMAHQEIIGRFSRKEANVLLGTQMVAKGHDIENVTLVGILAADSTMNLPDFRASERGFSLLTQAAGRAGRGSKRGRVVLQTYDPENPIIQLAARQDYDTFARGELAQRKELSYPPFSRILKLTVSDTDQGDALKLADEAAAYLRRKQKEEGWTGTEVLGPVPSGVAKVRDQFRMTILVKTREEAEVKRAILASGYKEIKNIWIDVDPLTVL